MKKYIILLLLAPFFVLQGQNKTVLFEFDYARFKNDDSTAYLDVFYSIFQNQFAKKNVDGKNIIEATLNIVLERISDKKKIEEIYKTEAIVDTKDTISKNWVGHLPYRIPFGEYRCFLIVKDLNKKENQDSLAFSFPVLPFPKDNFSMSDIEIADTIYKTVNKESIFYRNTFEVRPYPRALYSNRKPLVQFYCELYNLNVNIQSNEIKFRIQLLNSMNKIVFTRNRSLPRKNKDVVKADEIVPVHKYPSGAYTLLVSLTDTVANTSFRSAKKIFLNNPDIKDTANSNISDLDFLSSEFASMGEDEIVESFDVAVYIATKGEVKQWGKLKDLDGKRNFMFNFWKNRDKSPETPLNEDKRNYQQRLDYVNLNYSSFKRKGWKTDRGRVYLTYGVPSEVERYPSAVDTKPYERWKYDELEGGVEFIFADLTGFGDYLLLHSTLRGELRDEEWERRIKQMQ